MGFHQKKEGGEGANINVNVFYKIRTKNFHCLKRHKMLTKGKSLSLIHLGLYITHYIPNQTKPLALQP
jgi:hypothetical protein